MRRALSRRRRTLRSTRQLRASAARSRRASRLRRTPPYGARDIGLAARARADHRAFAQRTLGVVGWRLSRNPGARVILAPSTAADEPSWLSFARAETVREYLEEVWDVPRARIEIRPGARRRS